ncbi:MAG: hypothetical protein ACO1OG_05740 [Devosia sp.]
MPPNISSFAVEARSAFRGLLGLLTGDRGSPQHFDLSQRGLAGSFLACVLVLAAEAVVLIGLGRGSASQAVWQQVIAYIGWLGATSTYLRLIGRPDALLPQMVTMNWLQAALSIVTVALVPILGTPGIVAVLIIYIIVWVNIARLISTLRPGQMAALFACQFVGSLAAILVIMAVFPPSAAELAEAARISSFQ